MDEHPVALPRRPVVGHPTTRALDVPDVGFDGAVDQALVEAVNRFHHRQLRIGWMDAESDPGDIALDKLLDDDGHLLRLDARARRLEVGLRVAIEGRRVDELDRLAEIARPNRIKKVLKAHEPFRRMIYQNRGDKVRALFDRSRLPPSEKIIRNRIRRAGLWMR